MTTRKRILWLASILVTPLLCARAQEDRRPQAPLKYRMELVYVFEGSSTEFIFVVGNVGFKSVAALKSYVGNLPSGSKLEWAPGCLRLGGEPLLSSGQEIEEFKAFCAEKNIDFILVPSG